MIEAVIFDIDGTIIDSVDGHTKAWQAAFQKYGKPLSYDKIRGQIGKGGDQLMPVFLSKDEFERIRQDGKKIMLVSLAKEDELESYEKIAKIKDLTEGDTSSEDADRSKPHPDIFKVALDKLGDIAHDNVLVVGDTIYDVQAAAKVGLDTIGLSCGARQKHSYAKRAVLQSS